MSHGARKITSVQLSPLLSNPMTRKMHEGKTDEASESRRHRAVGHPHACDSAARVNSRKDFVR